MRPSRLPRGRGSRRRLFRCDGQQVLAVLIGRNEPEAREIAEPLHRSGRHRWSPWSCLADQERLRKGNELQACRAVKADVDRAPFKPAWRRGSKQPARLSAAAQSTPKPRRSDAEQRRRLDFPRLLKGSVCDPGLLPKLPTALPRRGRFVACPECGKPAQPIAGAQRLVGFRLFEPDDLSYSPQALAVQIPPPKPGREQS